MNNNATSKHPLRRAFAWYDALPQSEKDKITAQVKEMAANAQKETEKRIAAFNCLITKKITPPTPRLISMARAKAVLKRLLVRRSDLLKRLRNRGD